MGIYSLLSYNRVVANEIACEWILRSSRRDGSATGVVMSLPHGYGPSTYFPTGADDEAAACAKLGMPVVSPDGGTTTFGNDYAIASVASARTHLINVMGARDDRIFLIGMSMGALDVCNWARQNLSLVAGIAMVTPALDLAAVRLINGTYTAEVDAAYGGSAAVTAALPTHSPTVYAEELTDVPIKIWYSSDDPMAPLSQFQSFVDDTGAELVNLGAVGHNPSAAAGSDIADWFLTI